MSRLRKTWLPLITNPVWSGGAPLVTYTIAGTVYDSDGTTAVASATVALGAYSATSAANGTYTISDVPAGTSGSMTCTKAGYIWAAKTIAAMSGNLTAQNYTNVWYALGGKSANFIAAFEPKGKANAAAALVNLGAGGATWNSANGVAYPGFDTSYGWGFTAASSQYLTVGSTALVTAVPFTIVALFQSNDVTGDYALGSVRQSSIANNGWICMAAGAQTGDPVRATTIQAGAPNSGSSTAGFTASTWRTAVATFVTSTARYAYLDGANKGQSTASNSPGATVNTTLIGASHNATALELFLDGKIAAIGFLNTSLSDAEVGVMNTALAALVA